MTKINAPTKEQLAQWDAEDPLSWTRAEFEIPNAKACGGEVGELQLVVVEAVTNACTEG